ncbi:MAG: hypothetical protein K6G18_00750 [Treponema sp.]|nr:hypothetical protein [Treponema sp.]
MKKLFVTGLAVLAAGLLAVSFMACNHSSSGSSSSSSSDGTAYLPASGNSANSVPTYSGSMTVNGASYTTLTMNGSSSSGTATLSGGAANLSGTYARAVATAAAASEFTGSYTITFSSGTITVTFNGNSITLTNGSITASGTGTLVVQASSGSTGSRGSSHGAGYNYSDERPMTAAEQAHYNRLLGTRWRDRYYVPVADRASSYNSTFYYSELIINADGTGENKTVKEDKEGNVLEVKSEALWDGNETRFDGSWVEFDTDDSEWWFLMMCSTSETNSPGYGFLLSDNDGDGVFDQIGGMIKLN